MPDRESGEAPIGRADYEISPLPAARIIHGVGPNAWLLRRGTHPPLYSAAGDYAEGADSSGQAAARRRRDVGCGYWRRPMLGPRRLLLQLEGQAQQRLLRTVTADELAPYRQTPLRS